MKIEFEYMKMGLFGWECPFCYSGFPFDIGAANHEMGIVEDYNGKGCKNAPPKED